MTSTPLEQVKKAIATKVSIVSDPYEKLPSHLGGVKDAASAVIEALRPTIEMIDAEQGPSNYEEDNFEAGWHACIQRLKILLDPQGVENK